MVYSIKTGKAMVIHGRQGAVVDGTAKAVCDGVLYDDRQTDHRDAKITCPDCKAKLAKPKQSKPKIGYPPDRCDACNKPLPEAQAVYDAKTKLGPWGWFCPNCFQEMGVGLGEGRGQKYLLQEGRWCKVEG